MKFDIHFAPATVRHLTDAAPSSRPESPSSPSNRFTATTNGTIANHAAVGNQFNRPIVKYLSLRRHHWIEPYTVGMTKPVALIGALRR